MITLLDYCAIWWLGYSLCDILKVHVPWLFCVLLFTLLPHVILMNDRHEKLGTDSHSFGVAWGISERKQATVHQPLLMYFK